MHKKYKNSYIIFKIYILLRYYLRMNNHFFNLEQTLNNEEKYREAQEKNKIKPKDSNEFFLLTKFILLPFVFIFLYFYHKHKLFNYFLNNVNYIFYTLCILVIIFYIYKNSKSPKEIHIPITWNSIKIKLIKDFQIAMILYEKKIIILENIKKHLSNISLYLDTHLETLSHVLQKEIYMVYFFSRSIGFPFLSKMTIEALMMDTSKDPWQIFYRAFLGVRNYKKIIPYKTFNSKMNKSIIENLSLIVSEYLTDTIKSINILKEKDYENILLSLEPLTMVDHTLNQDQISKIIKKASDLQEFIFFLKISLSIQFLEEFPVKDSFSDILKKNPNLLTLNKEEKKYWNKIFQ